MITVATTKRFLRKYLKMMAENEIYLGDRDSYRYKDSGFRNAIEGYYDEHLLAIAIKKHNQQIVGAAVKLSEPVMYYCNIGCYVIPQFRRKGIGSQLVNKLVQKSEINNDQFPDGFPKSVSD